MARIVDTRSGRVRGSDVDTSTGTVEAYLGIPFAAPPVGSGRFRPPRREEAWDGVRDATLFGPAMPQLPDMMLAMSGVAGPPTSEADGLNLAVWTPAADDAARPVIVWVHGGAYMNGFNGAGAANGGELAAAGDVVVVALNYRLGVLGFLHLDHLLGDDYRDSAGVALLDLIAGLRWVQDSIRAFGGDPHNVTLMGESAGGAAVATLLGSPLAAGLFSRAIIQSGTAERVRSAADAEALTAIVLEEAGLDAGSAAELIDLPVDELLAAQERVVQRLSVGVIGITIPFMPTVGGELLPTAPLDAIRSGLNSRVELLIGTNLNEGSFFTAMPNPLETRTPQRRASTVLEEVFEGAVTYDDYADAVADATGQAPQALDVLEALLADRTYRQPTMRLIDARTGAGAAVTFAYLFTWPSPMMDGIFGACHALDVPFVFRRLGSREARLLVGDTPPTELSDWMSCAWARFARTGTPTAEAADWPVHDSHARATAILDETRRVENDPRQALRTLWAGRNAR